jgi:hypothetical protein
MHCPVPREDRSLSLPRPFLLSTTFAMAFSLNGTYIEGGTFNSVAGNMSQVFTSHVVPVGLLSGNEVSRDHPRLEGGHELTGEVHVCGGCAIFDRGCIGYNREQWFHWAHQKSKSAEESGYTPLR